MKDKKDKKVKKTKEAKFFCESCGQEVSQNARFCTNCGKFFSSVRCPNCGHTGTTDQFKNGCPECGYAVNKTSGALYQVNRKVNNGHNLFFSRGKQSVSTYSYQDGLPWWVYVSAVSTLIVIICCFYSCLK